MIHFKFFPPSLFIWIHKQEVNMPSRQIKYGNFMVGSPCDLALQPPVSGAPCLGWVQEKNTGKKRINLKVFTRWWHGYTCNSSFHSLRYQPCMLISVSPRVGPGSPSIQPRTRRWFSKSIRKPVPSRWARFWTGKRRAGTTSPWKLWKLVGHPSTIATAVYKITYTRGRLVAALPLPLQLRKP